MKTTSPSKSGFSLVEVALALGIGSFCMLTLLGLIPVGLHNFQQADARSMMVDLATSVAQDLESTSVGTAPTKSPRFSFMVPPSGGSTDTTPQTVFVDASGAPTSGAMDANSIYRLSVAFTPPQPGSKMATTARILVTFPAHADPSTATWPTKYATMLQTTVSLNRN